MRLEKAQPQRYGGIGARHTGPVCLGEHVSLARRHAQAPERRVARVACMRQRLVEAARLVVDAVREPEGQGARQQPGAERFNGQTGIPPRGQMVLIAINGGAGWWEARKRSFL